MPLTNDQIIDIVLGFEGGYSDDPNDHGGPTNFGITAADYGRWLGQAAPATPVQVQAMSVATARAIYQKWYIEVPGFDAVPDDGLRLVLVDSGVLFGTARATTWLQQEAGATVDGKLGRETIDKIGTYAAPTLLSRRVLGRRFKAIAGIVQNDASQIAFLRGWINRAVSLLDYL